MLEFTCDIFNLEKYIIQNGFVKQIGERIYEAKRWFCFYSEDHEISICKSDEVEITSKRIYVIYKTESKGKAVLFLDIKSEIGFKSYQNEFVS